MSMAELEELRRRVASLEAEVTVLRRDKAMLQLVIDTLPQTIFWKDRDLVYQGCSHDFAIFAGFSGSDDIVGKTDYDMAWRREESDAFRADDRKVLDSEIPKLHIIEPQLRADGTQTWVETSKLPLRDPISQAIVGVVGTYENITERMLAQEAERQERELIIEGQHMVLRELSTPLIPISNGVVAMTLIGTIDSLRAQQVLETLLDGITSYQAEHAILDITGVRVVDTQVAAALVRVAQAARLLGATVILTGISAEVAQALVELGAELGSMVTRSNLQRGIAYALGQE